MSYLGSAPAPSGSVFAGVYSQAFNGDGSTTSFTLGRYVAQAANIEVIVNNVQQSPFDGSYSLIGGTSLVFSEAPSTGTNNIYVIYRDYPVQTLTDTGAVRKTGDTITGALTLNSTLTSTTGNLIRVENPAGGRYGILATDSNGTYLSSHNTSGEPLTLLAPSTTGYVAVSTNGLERVRVNNAGCITKPYQPKFRAANTVSFSTISSTFTEIPFTTEYFDDGGNYNTSNGRFTAPVAGTYYFHASLQPTTTGIGVNMNLWVNGSASAYMANGWINNFPARSDITVSGLLKLSAGDYVSVYAWSTSACGFDNHGMFQGFLVG